MHRIDGPGAAPGNLFTEGNPGSGVPATTVTDDWMNAVQEELVHVLALASLTPNKPDNTQLGDALEILIRRAKPIGMVITGYWTAAPTGTLLLQGSLVSRSTYSALWAHVQAIGVVVDDSVWTAGEKGKFSDGDGSSTFRLPDLRDQFVRAKSAARTLGSLQDDELKSHSHQLLDSGVEGSNPDVQAFGQAGGAVNGLSSNTQDTGGTETRPMNVALTAAIYY
jgi:hypothetical protein